MITYETTSKGNLLTKFETKPWGDLLVENERIIMLSLYMHKGYPRTSKETAEDTDLPVLKVEKYLRNLEVMGYVIRNF